MNIMSPLRSSLAFTFLVCAASTAACGAKGTDAPPAPSAGAADPYDWSGVALESTDLQVEGLTIRLDMPRGLVLDTINPKRHLYVAAGDDSGRPKIELAVGALHATSLDRMKLDSSMDPMTVTKKEALADGLMIAGKNPEGKAVEVHVNRPLGDGSTKVVRCSGSQLRSKGIPNPDATLAMLEKACRSFVVVKGKTQP